MVPPSSSSRCSHHWVQIQQDHIDHDGEISSTLLTGQRWLQKVLNHLWTHPCLAWKLRNANLHCIDTADQEAKRKAELKLAIVALHKAADKPDCFDERLFEAPILTRLDDHKSHDQTAWINVVMPTARQAKADAADKIQQTQRDIPCKAEINLRQCDCELSLIYESGAKCWP
jgi:hypothetical protein